MNIRKNSAPLIQFDTKSLTINDWAAETGIPAAAIRWRLNHGWTIEKALTTPKEPRSK